MNCKITNETQKIVKRNQEEQYIIAMQGITGTNNNINLYEIESLTQITDSNRHIAYKITALVEQILAIVDSKYSLSLVEDTSYSLPPSPTPPAGGGASVYPPSSKKDNSAFVPPPLVEGVRGRGESHKPILESRTNQALTLQRQIDELVYQLYNLNSQEIAIIESAQKTGGDKREAKSKNQKKEIIK